MPEPLVSFVVLSYNFADFLGDCIRSILNQECEYEVEVILIDDASTDRTTEVLDAINDSRVRVIRHSLNLGHAATVSEALASARGRFVARIDGDDRYRSHFLRATIPVFEKYPEVGLVYGDAALIDSQGRITSQRSDRMHSGKDHKGNELVALLEMNFICAPTVIARREAWLACLPVPKGLAFHDWHFTVSMARKHEFYYMNQVLADYRVHNGNHHTRIIQNKSEEPSIFYVLNGVFGERETSRALEQAKQRARRRIYGSHYAVLADKYFGAGYNDDSRRCYLAAIRHHLGYLLDFGIQRRLAATIVGRERYERGKALLKSALSRG